MRGGTGNDTLHGGIGADILNGEDGFDKADYRYSAEAVTVNLSTDSATGGDAEGAPFSSIENLAGSRFNDILTGNDERNVMYGNGGDDILFGGLGNDYLKGGAGNDTFVFNSALDLGVNRDAIADFTIGQEK
jgi:Ca2+-binding RTX toxin-like protein